MVFNIDGDQWTLDLREGHGEIYEGSPKEDDKADLTLTISDDNFVKLVNGKIGPQQVGINCLVLIYAYQMPKILDWITQIGTLFNSFATY